MGSKQDTTDHQTTLGQNNNLLLKFPSHLLYMATMKNMGTACCTHWWEKI